MASMKELGSVADGDFVCVYVRACDLLAFILSHDFAYVN